MLFYRNSNESVEQLTKFSKNRNKRVSFLNLVIILLLNFLTNL